LSLKLRSSTGLPISAVTSSVTDRNEPCSPWHGLLFKSSGEIAHLPVAGVAWSKQDVLAACVNSAGPDSVTSILFRDSRAEKSNVSERL